MAADTMIVFRDDVLLHKANNIGRTPEEHLKVIQNLYPNEAITLQEELNLCLKK